MFSRTLRCGKSAYDWNTIEIRRAAGLRCVTSRPSMTMRPSDGVSSPAIMRSVVDLPQPDGPRRTTSRPEAVANEMRSTARASPHSLLTPSRPSELTLWFGSGGDPVASS